MSKSNKDGKLIAVWGSPGAGKTTVSVKLAVELAQKHKDLDVMIILTDITAPDMPIILPVKKDMRSMGNLWNNPRCDKEMIYNASMVTEKYDNLSILGYKACENVFSHADYTKEIVFKVFNELETMADYIVIDCVSDFAFNMISMAALELADSVIRVGEATLKSFSFFDSNLPLLTDSRYQRDAHIRILGKTKSFQSRDIAMNKLGTELELPYVEEIEKQMLEGGILHKASGREYECYQKAIQAIVSRVEESEWVK